MRHIPRLYLNCKLSEGAVVTISVAQMHHAANVLRLKVGDTIKVFNEEFGEWNCEISDIKKRTVACISLFKECKSDKDGAILACSLINPNRMSILLEKVTELGVSEIIPIISQYTQYRKFNHEKAMQIIIGACEQSGRITLPKLANIVKLDDFLEKYPYDCKMIVGDENFSGDLSLNIMKQKRIFLVGPEGGFSESEREMFDKYKFIEKVFLGNDILRSETAAIAFVASHMLLKSFQ